MGKQKIAITCDHAGYEMKLVVKTYLEKLGYEVLDFGADSKESVDYPDFVHPMADAIEEGSCAVGFALCGSGNGVNMAANKHEAIRSALCWNVEIAELARSHNNANICALPARFIANDLAQEIVRVFIETEFEGGRHERRINKIPIV